MVSVICHKCGKKIFAENFEILNKLAIAHDKEHKPSKKPEGSQ